MTTAEILNEEADKLIADLIANYDRLGLRASGAWASRLRKEVSSTRMQIFGAPYTGALEDGRRPTSIGAPLGNPPLRKVIEDWVRVKGIQPNEPTMSIEDLARRITYAIHKGGIRVPNQYNAGGLLFDVITDMRLVSIRRKVQFAEIESIKSDIIKIFKFK